MILQKRFFMAEDNRQNFDKDRKTEAQKRFDAADNAGRFAGGDEDANNARNRAEQDVRREANTRNESDNSGSDDRDNTDEDARRDPAQSHTFIQEAQNVADDNVGDVNTLSNEEASKARNKANEGIRQGRQDTEDSTNI